MKYLNTLVLACSLAILSLSKHHQSHYQTNLVKDIDVNGNPYPFIPRKYSGCTKSWYTIPNNT